MSAVRRTPHLLFEGSSIAVRALAEGDAIRLEVRDAGPGIRAEDVSRLFVDFQQLDTGIARAHGGTGLGLALTKRVTEALGGRVGVETAPGRGSVFFAVIPRRAAEPAASAVGGARP